MKTLIYSLFLLLSIPVFAQTDKESSSTLGLDSLKASVDSIIKNSSIVKNKPAHHLDCEDRSSDYMRELCTKRFIEDFVAKNIELPVNDDNTFKVTQFVMVSFIINKEGLADEIRIESGINTEIDNAVIACFEKLPKFVPGTKDGEKSNSKMNISITIRN